MSPTLRLTFVLFALLSFLTSASVADAVPFRLQAVADGEVFDHGLDGFDTIDPLLSRSSFNACALGCTARR